jgi:hypothetical protein
MIRHLPLLVLLSAAVPATTVAQQAACKTVEVPVSPISISGDIFRGLNAEDFVAHIQKKPVVVKAATYDDGPRRILLVVDTSKKLSSDTRKAEDLMIQAILAGANPQDSFALLTARGPGKDVPFTTDHNAITQALRDESKKASEQDVLDAVMAGIEHFGEPQSGDAIVVIAAEMEKSHKTNEKLVAKALQDHHIRMFGLALAPVSTRNVTTGGSMTSTVSQGLAWTTPGIGDIIYNTGDENFFPLTVNSGGLVMVPINADTRHSYNMADAKLQQSVQQKARAIAKMIDAFYRIQLEPPQLSRPETLTLDVTDSLKKRTQQMWLLYPNQLGPC